MLFARESYHTEMKNLEKKERNALGNITSSPVVNTTNLDLQRVCNQPPHQETQEKTSKNLLLLDPRPQISLRNPGNRKSSAKNSKHSSSKNSKNSFEATKENPKTIQNGSKTTGTTGTIGTKGENVNKGKELGTKGTIGKELGIPQPAKRKKPSNPFLCLLGPPTETNITL